MVKTEYIHCHNNAAAHMHWKFYKEFGLEVKERWYKHESRDGEGKLHRSVGHAHPH